MNNLIKIFLISISLNLAADLSAAPVVINSEQIDGLSVGRQLLLLEDKAGTLTIEDVAGLPDSAFFMSKEDVPNFSFTKSAYWARLELNNAIGKDKQILLEYGYAMADFVDFYMLSSAGGWNKMEAGDRRPPSKRVIRHRLAVFPYELKTGTSTIFLRVQTQGVNQFPVKIWSVLEFQYQDTNEMALLIFMFGTMAIMIFYNLFIAIQTKSVILYLYVAYLFPQTVCFVSGQSGLLNLTKFDELSILLMNKGYLLSAACVAFSASLFSIKYLEISKDIKLSFYCLCFVMGFSGLSFVASLFEYNLGSKPTAIATSICVIAILVSSVQRSLQKYRPAYFFGIAWFSVVMGSLIYGLVLAGLVSSHPLLFFAPAAGTVIEIFLISLAIGDKMRNQIGAALTENLRINAELITKEKARTIFFQNTSHELRTPLNGIIGFLDLLLKSRFGELSRPVTQQLHKTLGLAESLKTQVNTILDLARSHRDELKLRSTQFPLGVLHKDLDDLAEGLCVRYPKTRYSSEILLDGHPETMIQDREKLFTLVRNLLGNAFKFIRFDTENHVHLRLKRVENDLLIEVSDTGIGIPEDQFERIFEDFAQVQDDARRSYEGTGLGLAMVRNIVRLMGGTIALESKPNQGSLFRIRVPEQAVAMLEDPLDNQLAVAADSKTTSPLPVPLERAKAEATSKSLMENPYSILVVDDNLDNCELILALLDMHGYQVRTALGGKSALERLNKESFDLVLLDLMMPEVSGEDVLKVMREDTELRDIPVILLTARASEEDRIHGLGLGADDYLAKPIKAEELLLRVGNLLQRLKATRRNSQEEMDDNMHHLGEIFAFVSHEIKNVFQTIPVEHKFEPEDFSKLLKFSPLSDDTTKALAASLCEDRRPSSFQALSALLPRVPKEHKLLRLLQVDLSIFGLKDAEAVAIWSKIIALSESEQESLEKLLRLLIQHKQLWGAMHRSQDIFLSALGFIRDEKADHCHLWDSLDSSLSMAALRARHDEIKFEADIKRIELAVAPMALQQIIINLLGNAMDAVLSLPAEDRLVRIWVEEVPENGRVQIKVLNSGVCISQETVSHLFQRGFTTKGSKGNGLGLYFSKKLARRFHGELLIDTSGGKTCFVLELNRVKTNSAAKNTAKSA